MRLLPALCLGSVFACAESPAGGDPAPDADPPADTDVPGAALPSDARFVPLAPERMLRRVSLGLRQRPGGSASEVRDNPAVLLELADAWSRSDDFADQVFELWAEVLHTRSVDLIMPELGPLLRTSIRERALAVADEPLHLIREVVASGEPFPSIFRTDWTMLDAVGMKMWAGHDGDPEAAQGFERVHWIDGRPAAGILSTHGLWARHVSNGENFHRERAAMLSEAFLCTDLGGLDVPIDPDLDLSDPAVVSTAVRTDPACVSCHQALDPLAAHLWPIFPVPSPGAVLASYSAGCNIPGLTMCYPARVWRPQFEALRPLAGVRPPSYWGEASADLGTLAAHIASDPRFHTCTVRRLAGWITQTPPHEVPFEQVARWLRAYESADHDLRALAVAIVTDPSFLAEDVVDPDDAHLIPGPLMMRPRALSRSVAAVLPSELRFAVNLPDPTCLLTGLNCYGVIDPLDDPVLGWHVLAGGTDGARTLRPTLDPTPMLLLAQKALAEEHAWAFVSVLSEAVSETEDLRLSDDADAPLTREGLALLHGFVFSGALPASEAEIDALQALLRDALEVRQDPARAWADVAATMLRSPAFLLY